MIQICELRKVILEMRTVLYGEEQLDPVKDVCQKLTLEFFKEDTFRMLIASLPDLEPGTRQDVTHVIANLQRQQVNGRYIVSEYLECNIDVLTMLLPGWTLPFTVVPTALATALDINLSNASLVFISVTFATMCKSASPIFLLIFAFAFRLETPSVKLLGIILVIYVGILLTVAKEIAFEFWGFIFCHACCCYVWFPLEHDSDPSSGPSQ